jgi:hypothetical protein
MQCRSDRARKQGDRSNKDCMGKYDKLIDKILRGTSDANIPFDDLRGMLTRLGFDERIRGSHHVYRKEGIEEKLNLQRDGSKAKPYQVLQVRFIIIKYHLAGEE